MNEYLNKYTQVSKYMNEVKIYNCSAYYMILLVYILKLTTKIKFNMQIMYFNDNDIIVYRENVSPYLLLLLF